jgi:CRISPR/Cas system CSM-associated protein Csm3 (group 7 of RAMP superfamily)
MSIPVPFTHGVTSLLKCSWTVELKTPLVIRASTSAAIHNKNKEEQKGRRAEYNFRWEDLADDKDKNKEWSAVKDFNYDFFVAEDNTLKARYSIPGSSVRGALRQWTIQALVKEKEKGLFSLPKLGNEVVINKAERMKIARKAVEDNENYWHDILSLFGIAFDLNPGVDDPLTWSGRLDIGTVNLIPAEQGSTDGYVYDVTDVNACAPKNIKSHLKTRSPLDRVTMAARDRGLHSGIEMSEGERFTLEFWILNPRPNDLRILKLWKRDLDAGFIRFGGLTSQGRGRVKIEENFYTLYAAANTPLATYLRKLGKADVTESDMLFSDIWSGAELDLEILFEPDFMATLNAFHNPS